MKIKSNLQLKAEDLADAVHDFVSAILATKFVDRVANTVFVALFVIGWLGVLWIVLALFCIPNHGDGAHIWLRTFALGHPWLAAIWLLDSIGAVALIIWSFNQVPQKSFPPEKI